MPSQNPPKPKRSAIPPISTHGGKGNPLPAAEAGCSVPAIVLPIDVAALVVTGDWLAFAWPAVVPGGIPCVTGDICSGSCCTTPVGLICVGVWSFAEITVVARLVPVVADVLCGEVF